MKTSSTKLDPSHVVTTHRTITNEEAHLRCQSALELKDQGEYEKAQEALRPLWGAIGERPQTEGLLDSVAAEVLLCVGILTRWIGSRNRISEAPHLAKDFISESINYYESVGDVKKVAAARAELAYCYWAAGALDEARIMFREALQKLTTEGNTRARALLRLAIVEWSASRYSDALTILTTNASLVEKISNDAIKGAYHSQLAMVLRELATHESKDDYFHQAIVEYKKADQHFKLARNIVFRADVLNNVGNILRQLGRFKEAHKFIGEARRLAVGVKDKVQTAQFDDTLAQVLIAETRFAEAEGVARDAAFVLEKSGQQCLLADALITHGIAIARLHDTEGAQFTFQRVIEVALQVDAYNKAGLAALTMIEELGDDLPSDVLHAAYNGASEWLAQSQIPDLPSRLDAAARKVLSRKPREGENPKVVLLIEPCDLHEEVLKYEGNLIKRALVTAGGHITRAAALLRTTHQALGYIIQGRHPELLKYRTEIHRRSRIHHRSRKHR